MRSQLIAAAFLIRLLLVQYDAALYMQVRHVALGLKWFKAICAATGIQDPVPHFHTKVRQYLPDLLPGPFNEVARKLFCRIAAFSSSCMVD